MPFPVPFAFDFDYHADAMADYFQRSGGAEAVFEKESIVSDKNTMNESNGTTEVGCQREMIDRSSGINMWHGGCETIGCPSRQKEGDEILIKTVAISAKPKTQSDRCCNVGKLGKAWLLKVVFLIQQNLSKKRLANLPWNLTLDGRIRKSSRQRSVPPLPTWLLQTTVTFVNYFNDALNHLLQRGIFHDYPLWIALNPSEQKWIGQSPGHFALLSWPYSKLLSAVANRAEAHNSYIPSVDVDKVSGCGDSPSVSSALVAFSVDIWNQFYGVDELTINPSFSEVIPATAGEEPQKMDGFKKVHAFDNDQKIQTDLNQMIKQPNMREHEWHDEESEVAEVSSKRISCSDEKSSSRFVDSWSIPSTTNDTCSLLDSLQKRWRKDTPHEPLEKLSPLQNYDSEALRKNNTESFELIASNALHDDEVNEGMIPILSARNNNLHAFSKVDPEDAKRVLLDSLDDTSIQSRKSKKLRTHKKKKKKHKRNRSIDPQQENEIITHPEVELVAADRAKKSLQETDFLGDLKPSLCHSPTTKDVLLPQMMAPTSTQIESSKLALLHSSSQALKMEHESDCSVVLLESSADSRQIGQADRKVSNSGEVSNSNQDCNKASPISFKNAIAITDSENIPIDNSQLQLEQRPSSGKEALQSKRRKSSNDDCSPDDTLCDKTNKKSPQRNKENQQSSFRLALDRVTLPVRDPLKTSRKEPSSIGMASHRSTSNHITQTTQSRAVPEIPIVWGFTRHSQSIGVTSLSSISNKGGSSTTPPFSQPNGQINTHQTETQHVSCYKVMDPHTQTSHFVGQVVVSRGPAHTKTHQPMSHHGSSTVSSNRLSVRRSSAESNRECAPIRRAHNPNHNKLRPGILKPPHHQGASAANSNGYFQPQRFNTIHSGTLTSETTVPTLHDNVMDDLESNALQNSCSSTTVRVLCSERFLDTWSDIAADLGAGRWRNRNPYVHDIPSTELPIELVDSYLVDISEVDLELPNRCAILIYTASALERTNDAKDIVLSVARLVSTGRYLQIIIFLSYDVPITDEIARHIVQLQTAAMCNGLTLPTFTFFKTASPTTLSAAIGSTVFAHTDTSHSRLIERTNDPSFQFWAGFLLKILPILTASGALQCLQLAQQKLPSHKSEISSTHELSPLAFLLQNEPFRKKLAEEVRSGSLSKASSIHPDAMNMLSKALLVSISC